MCCGPREHLFHQLKLSHFNTNKQAGLAAGVVNDSLPFFESRPTEMWVLAAIWVGILNRQKPSGQARLSFPIPAFQSQKNSSENQKDNHAPKVT